MLLGSKGHLRRLAEGPRREKISKIVLYVTRQDLLQPFFNKSSQPRGHSLCILEGPQDAQ